MANKAYTPISDVMVDEFGNSYYIGEDGRGNQWKIPTKKGGSVQPIETQENKDMGVDNLLRLLQQVENLTAAPLAAKDTKDLYDSSVLEPIPDEPSAPIDENWRHSLVNALYSGAEKLGKGLESYSDTPGIAGTAKISANMLRDFLNKASTLDIIGSQNRWSKDYLKAQSNIFGPIAKSGGSMPINFIEALLKYGK